MDSDASHPGSLAIIRNDLRAVWAQLKAEKLVLAAVSALTLIALLLRLAFLNQSMRCDESWTYLELSSQSLYHAVSYYPGPGNHLLHSALVALSTQAFGSEPWAIRLPAFLAGVLMVPAAYVAWRAHFCRRVGLLAAALVAGGGAYLVSYSVNARGYTLAALIFLLMAAMAAYVARRQGVRLAWVMFAVISAFGFAAMPTMIYGFAGLVIWLAGVAWLQRDLSVTRRAFFINLALACILTVAFTLVLYLPAMLSSGPSAVFTNRYIAPKGFGAMFAELPGTFMQAWQKASLPLAGPLAFAGLVLAVVGMARYRKVSSWRLPVFFTIVCAVIVVLIAQRVVPYVRVWTLLIPVYYALVAAGIVVIFRRPLERNYVHVGLSLAICALLAWMNYRTRMPAQFADDGIFPGGETVATYLISQNLGDRDRVVATLSDKYIIEYYAARQGFRGRIRFMSNEDELAPTPLDLSGAGRVLLVVNDQMSNPRDTAQTVRLPLEQLRRFVPLQGFFDSTVYERSRRD